MLDAHKLAKFTHGRAPCMWPSYEGTVCLCEDQCSAADRDVRRGPRSHPLHRRSLAGRQAARNLVFPSTESSARLRHRGPWRNGIREVEMEVRNGRSETAGLSLILCQPARYGIPYGAEAPTTSCL